MAKKPKPKKGRWIFRAWITRGGKRVYARDYGLKAWRIWIPNEA